MYEGNSNVGNSGSSEGVSEKQIVYSTSELNILIQTFRTTSSPEVFGLFDTKHTRSQLLQYHSPSILQIDISCQAWKPFFENTCLKFRYKPFCLQFVHLQRRAKYKMNEDNQRHNIYPNPCTIFKLKTKNSFH